MGLMTDKELDLLLKDYSLCHARAQALSHNDYRQARTLGRRIDRCRRKLKRERRRDVPPHYVWLP